MDPLTKVEFHGSFRFGTWTDVQARRFCVFLGGGVGQKFFGPIIFLTVKHISMMADGVALTICRCGFSLSRYTVKSGT